MTVFRSVILLLSVCTPLSAQFVGAGFQIVRSDQIDMRGSRGPGLRFGFGPVDLRYDYLVANGQRFDYPCAGFIPPGCVQETIRYSSHVHSIFLAARLRLLSPGSWDLFVLPEVGLTSGTFARQSVATPTRGFSSSGHNLGAGAALELAAARLGGTPVGGWIALRGRRFVAPGAYAVDGAEPHRQQNWIGSVELGVRYALP